MKSRIEKNHDKKIIEQLNTQQDTTIPANDTPVMSEQDKQQIKQLYNQYIRDNNEQAQKQHRHTINLFLNRGIIILTLLLIGILIIAFFF